ncbi:SDR family oxidoreductase [Psychromonas sp. B3M02]|uniref:SDR family oxidoreductase n=1 Tax=Psychromonas sp. B3M02 TaxID=2267226 RepID=UPI000DE8146D|nr:SDR family oxidoreductase [Psychromonas sp. B3M02]RBW44950.1 SDR family oxidoreductase [Psychromonas sp. B3M02]
MATIFITGANRGLGLEFVKQYAQQGHHVIACTRHFTQATELSQLATLHSNIQLHELNVMDEEQISELTTVFKNQPIDVLIHNAGVGGFQCEALGGMDQKGWLEVLTVNTVSPMLITQALLANILASKAKTIIGLTSILASIDDNNSGGRYSYRASKAALNQIIKSLACELSDDGVKAAVIHPGWVKTAMGGADGKITPAQSITGMMNVIENLQSKHSGSFFVYDGTQLPW